MTSSTTYPYYVSYPSTGTGTGAAIAGQVLTTTGSSTAYFTPQQLPTMDSIRRDMLDNTLTTLTIKDPDRIVFILDNKRWTLKSILRDCKNILYIEADEEVVIGKHIWAAIEKLISSDGYAGMTPSEFIDKLYQK